MVYYYSMYVSINKTSGFKLSSKAHIKTTEALANEIPLIHYSIS